MESDVPDGDALQVTSMRDVPDGRKRSVVVLVGVAAAIAFVPLSVLHWHPYVSRLSTMITDASGGLGIESRVVPNPTLFFTLGDLVTFLALMLMALLLVKAGRRVLLFVPASLWFVTFSTQIAWNFHSLRPWLLVTSSLTVLLFLAPALALLRHGGARREPSNPASRMASVFWVLLCALASAALWYLALGHEFTQQGIPPTWVWYAGLFFAFGAGIGMRRRFPWVQLGIPTLFFLGMIVCEYGFLRMWGPFGFSTVFAHDASIYWPVLVVTLTASLWVRLARMIGRTGKEPANTKALTGSMRATEP